MTLKHLGLFSSCSLLSFSYYLLFLTYAFYFIIRYCFGGLTLMTGLGLAADCMTLPFMELDYDL